MQIHQVFVSDQSNSLRVQKLNFAYKEVLGEEVAVFRSLQT